MPKTILSESPYHRTEYYRDEHDESGTIYSRKIFYDDEINARNEKVRNETKVKAGDKCPIHRGSKFVYLLKVNPLQWAYFKRQHPDLIKQLHSRDAFQREKACMKIQSMHPRWVVIAPKNSLS